MMTIIDHLHCQCSIASPRNFEKATPVAEANERRRFFRGFPKRTVGDHENKMCEIALRYPNLKLHLTCLPFGFTLTIWKPLGVETGNFLIDYFRLERLKAGGQTIANPLETFLICWNRLCTPSQPRIRQLATVSHIHLAGKMATTNANVHNFPCTGSRPKVASKN